MVQLVNTTMVANSGDSGAALALLGSTAVVVGCNFTQNNAAFSGGAVSAWESQLNITSSIFTSNYATAWRTPNFNQSGQLGYGGACLFMGSNVNMRSCSFADNKALEGGAVWFGRKRSGNSPSRGNPTMKTTLHMDNTTFTNNTAALGGAMFASYPAWVDMDGVTFTENNAGLAALDGSNRVFQRLKSSMLYHGVGGAIYNFKATIRMRRSRLESNTAVFDGGEHCMDLACSWTHSPPSQQLFLGG